MQSARPITLSQRCGVWWQAIWWLVDLLLQVLVAAMLIAADRPYWGICVFVLMFLVS